MHCSALQCEADVQTYGIYVDWLRENLPVTREMGQASYKAQGKCLKSIEETFFPLMVLSPLNLPCAKKFPESVTHYSHHYHASST